jgi:hypothetical protein
LSAPRKGGNLLGAILAGLVLGAFALAVVVVLVVNVRQSPLPPAPKLPEPVEHYRIGGRVMRS